MTDYIRRLVSGNKARFKDDKLNVELGESEDFTNALVLTGVTDLVYVTDQVIIMGYPASGIEGLYRNRREDAIRFLEHRHGKNYWVFNFCPIKENSYEADVFGGRVSRYPFPDHQYVISLSLFTNTLLTSASKCTASCHNAAGSKRNACMAIGISRTRRGSSL